MSTQTVILRDKQRRQVAKSLVDLAPLNAVVTIREETRTLVQNNRFWAMISDVRKHLKARGQYDTDEETKARVMHPAGWEIQYLEGLDGRPFPAGFSSSKLSVKEMSALMDWMEAWGAEQGVRFMTRDRTA